jgi:homoprotocatechuate degradation regulator HpaR
MIESRTMPPFEQSLAAVLLGAKEAVIAPMRARLREHNITEPQWRVMRVINDRGATDATGLADVGLLHAPSVTRILRELEQRSLILREPDRNDRRRTLVALSPEGRVLVAEISAHVMDIVQDYSRLFGAARLDRLVEELRALSSAIRDIT